MLPTGPATAPAWQAGQYRRRGADRGGGVWAVPTGGFACAIVILAMLVTGAASVGVGRWWLFPAAAAMAAGTAAVLTAARRAGMTVQRLARHPGWWRSRLATGLAGGQPPGRSAAWCGNAGGQRPERARRGRAAAASFGVAGRPVPWRGLMLACAASRSAGPKPVAAAGTAPWMSGGLAACREGDPSLSADTACIR